MEARGMIADSFLHTSGTLLRYRCDAPPGKIPVAIVNP
jgi:hypothetical protein